MDDGSLGKRIRGHVAELAGTIGARNVFRPRTLRAAEEYVAGEWRRQGYAVEPVAYVVDGVRCANLEATRVGSARPREVLLLGAHYDTVRGSPGADDNGSGVAALLEISGLFAEIVPAATVRFVAFVNEEPPFFWSRSRGSLVYAKVARRRGDDIRFMASLECMGFYSREPRSQRYPPFLRFFYPGRGDFIGFVSNLRSRGILRRFAEAFRRHAAFPAVHAAVPAVVPGVSWSDHLSFWQQGYRALMITDTAFYRNPHYHTGTDTVEKVSCGALSEVTQGVFEAVAEMATES